jgi:hypothetical protein
MQNTREQKIHRPDRSERAGTSKVDLADDSRPVRVYSGRAAPLDHLDLRPGAVLLVARGPLVYPAVWAGGDRPVVSLPLDGWPVPSNPPRASPEGCHLWAFLRPADPHQRQTVTKATKTRPVETGRDWVLREVAWVAAVVARGGRRAVELGLVTAIGSEGSVAYLQRGDGTAALLGRHPHPGAPAPDLYFAHPVERAGTFDASDCVLLTAEVPRADLVA